jgi:hypothetical protein
VSPCTRRRRGDHGEAEAPGVSDGRGGGGGGVRTQAPSSVCFAKCGNVARIVAFKSFPASSG